MLSFYTHITSTFLQHLDVSIFLHQESESLKKLTTISPKYYLFSNKTSQFSPFFLLIFHLLLIYHIYFSLSNMKKINTLYNIPLILPSKSTI